MAVEQDDGSKQSAVISLPEEAELHFGVAKSSGICGPRCHREQGVAETTPQVDFQVPGHDFRRLSRKQLAEK